MLRRTPAHQVIESRLTFGIKMDDFAVQDGLARNRRSDGGRKAVGSSHTPFPGAIPASIALSRYIRERGSHHISAQKSSRGGRRVHGGKPKALAQNRENTSSGETTYPPYREPPAAIAGVRPHSAFATGAVSAFMRA